MSKLRISPDLTLPRDTVTQTIVVYGGKGMGKTNLGSVIAEELKRGRQRFSIIDPVGVWWGLQHAADGKGPGLEVLLLGGVHGDIPIEPTGGAIVADLVADEEVDVIIDISRRPNGKMWSIGERIRFVTDYCLRLFERQGERRRPIMQIIDEAGRYVPQQMPSGAIDLAKCVGAIEQLVELGRNVGVGVCLITQRSARMNKSVSELAECMVAFRTVGPLSIDAILDWFGEHVEKARWKELLAQLRTLPRGHALVVSPGWLEFEGVVKVRPRETFDSSATPTAGSQRRTTGKAAKPDLGKYRERMAATIEKAKADDPKALRARIVQLETELKKKPAAVAAPAAKGKPEDQAALRQQATSITRLRKALEAAMKFIINVSTHNFDVAGVDKAELERALQAAVGKAVQLVDQRLEARARGIEQLRRSGQQIVTGLKAALKDEDIIIDVEVTKNEPFTVASAAPHARRASREASLPPAEGLTGPQQAILDTVAMLNVRGLRPERDMVARWLGIHPNGGSYGANLGRLRADGYLDGFTLTDKGQAAARAQETGLEAALAALDGEPKRAIIRTLVDAGAPLSREELAEKLGLHPNGGSYGANLGWLRTMGLLTERGPITTTEALER